MRTPVDNQEVTMSNKDSLVNLRQLGINTMGHIALKFYLNACVLMCCGILVSFVHAQEIVLAFDDTLARSTSVDGTARTKMLINSMARADVHQAMFLVKTKNISEATLPRVEFYDATGQLIVNAGDSFTFYSRKKNYTFQIDILKANAKLENFYHYAQHVYSPYLTEDGDLQALKQVQDYLRAHDYRPTYITTRVPDDYLDQLYQRRITEGRTVDIRSLEKAYVKMILDEVKAYDAKARLLLGFHPRQVLLLHENDLAAYCIIGVIDALNAAGFRIIAPEKVFADPVANPYFVSGFSASSYMAYITGVLEFDRSRRYIYSTEDEAKVRGYLQGEGLTGLLPNRSE